MSERVLITGANGYIGKKLVSLFSNENEVLAIVRAFGNKISIKNIGNGGVEYCHDSEDLEKTIIEFKPSIIFSTTCCYETDPVFLQKTADSNYIFPSRILRAVQEIDNSLCVEKIRFVSIGTSLPSSLNLYSLTKKQFAELGEFFSSLGKIEFCNVLLESFYGADEPEIRFIPRTIRGLKKGQDINCTEGVQHRDYVSIDDVISILEFLAMTKNKLPQKISVGSGTAPSIREIIEYLSQITNSKSKLNFGAVPMRKNEPSSCADLTALRNLGYEKEITFWKDGMKKMAEEIV